MTGNEAIIRHDLDQTADLVFASVAVRHPEAVSTEADYPGWKPAACQAPHDAR